ncbi:MAG: bifunctional riboflavin kinase/FAD synthetase [Deltaproteobacteria bacterium]|nr:bifunctional riboflavin kinase/FAD synthetase [Deltaproteobacteria bacterium]
MKVFKNSATLGKIKNPVLTLGNFDGLHLGHRKIIKSVAARAKKLGVPSAVYTFDPHPLKVVSPLKSPPLLLDIEDKTRLVGEAGIDYLIFARFTREFAEKHPREFVEEVMLPLSVREVWVGHDFKFGRSKTGTVEYLKELGGEFGFRVVVVDAYKKGGHIVSSSRIRSLVSAGKVGQAAGLLGRRYSIKGRVVKGRNIGKGMGFPTANLKVSSELLPAGGVYAAYAAVDGRTLPAVLNIGKAPTFGGRDTTVEVHILDFNGDIYGREMEVSFVRRIRSEKAFKSKEGLVARIKKDAERARAILTGPRAALVP